MLKKKAFLKFCGGFTSHTQYNFSIKQTANVSDYSNISELEFIFAKVIINLPGIISIG
jgi:hypothetical protein